MSTVETAFASAPSPAEMDIEDAAIRQARIDFAAVHRIIVHEDMHEGTWNHFSCKVPGRPGHLLITPGQTHFSRVTASSLVEVGPDGRPVGGAGRLNVSAWAIHEPVQRARPDIMCALHIHAPYSTALASIDGWMLDERGSQNAAVFYGNCAYFGYEGIVTEADEGEHMVEALGDKRVLFLANHGVLMVGDTIEKTILWLYQLERACMNEMLALQTGRKIRPIPVEAAQQNAAMSVESAGEAGYLEGMKEMLDAEGQDYAT
ncbi:class II aldolase/adducin family protein [Candidatus Palauibacter sp.]|uniref:class II aldolase/adducin family protein n=1 Tax=Candidatus Palauibacter sp. TaxID=3101350 RepID=UPI003B516C6F